MAKARKILLIDDDDRQQHMVQLHLGKFYREQFELDYAPTYEDGLKKLLSGNHASACSTIIWATGMGWSSCGRHGSPGAKSRSSFSPRRTATTWTSPRWRRAPSTTSSRPT